MARDQWKDLTYDKNHGQGASKYRKSAYDNWDQDFEQTYVRKLQELFLSSLNNS